ncbi:site-specific integrase [uncultured Bifidobacterium sp.]|uniref:tyrosine-type recombinase/integrase n=3 Tax=Bifidobacterium TaxID=1678 RepID=UPI0025E5F79C|nr:site-specific integrase [uncultured Bifidobacterium sp.]
MAKRFGTVRYKPNRSNAKYIEASYMTPVWAFMRWPGLGERQYANFDVDDEDGARAWLREAKLRIDARAWQPEREEQREEERSRLTFGDYFPIWLEQRRTKGGMPLEAGSVYRLRKDAENHVLPYFGRMRLVDITPRDCDRWWDQLDHSQRAMCVNALKVLKAVPATVDQVKAIHDNMPARYADTIYIAVFCNGPRIGEICTLQRWDIDLEHLILHIRRSRKTIGPQTVGSTKTEHSVRDENIPPQYAPYLDRLLQQAGPEPDAWLFPSTRDVIKPIHPNSLRSWYDEARKAAGRPDLRFHDLRHTVLTLLAQQGATVRELMDAAGHADPQTAMRYQRSVSGRAQDLAKRIGNLIPHPTPSKPSDNASKPTTTKSNDSRRRTGNSNSASPRSPIRTAYRRCNRRNTNALELHMIKSSPGARR